MRELLSLDTKRLKEIMADLGEKPYAASQLEAWLLKGVPFEEMTNLPKALREKLRENFTEGYARVEQRLKSSDGTVKYLLEVSGGGYVECVFLRYRHGNTLCVSTQMGCAMGCVFCASGREGLERNLTAGEMRSQLLAARENGDISNVVLMGSGEPLDNYENVVAFIKMLMEKHGIGTRHISLSTCGLAPEMIRLSGEGLGITLCVSLHSAIDEKRKRIMPAAKYSVSQIMEAAKTYFKKTGRRIIIEYALMRGFNDGEADIAALKKAVSGLNCHINVIPLNSAFGRREKTGAGDARLFAEKLKNAGIGATVRRSLGSDIEGACGQLRLRHGRK